MTEQEVIKYLKKNRVEGVIISFMPKEVQNFCHLHKQNLLVWQSGQWYKFDADDIADDDVVTLSDSFQIQQEKKGGWVEFEINERGQFLVIFTQGLRYYFNWFEWWRLLEKSIDYNYGFITFGGWQYKDSKRWYLAPAVKLQDGEMWNSYIIEQSGEATPVIPKKIRFWRKAK